MSSEYLFACEADYRLVTIVIIYPVTRKSHRKVVS